MTPARTDQQRRDEYDPRQRFRPYARDRSTGMSEWVACAGCPTLEGIGPMLQTLRDDGEYTSADQIGILDTAPWHVGSPGHWLISPYAEGERS